jgi:hypothetical protein
MTRSSELLWGLRKHFPYSTVVDACFFPALR